MNEILKQDLYPTPVEIYESIAKLEPRPVQLFVPINGDEQRESFVAGEILNPSHDFPELESSNFAQSKLEILELARQFKIVLDQDSAEYDAYNLYASRYAKLYDFLQAARDTKSTDEKVANDAKANFMKLNIELYGEPDRSTYLSLLKESVHIDISNKHKDAANILISEIMQDLPELDDSVDDERFRPSAETIGHMGDIAQFLYGGMLEHIPTDQDAFDPEQIAEVFRNVISMEFGESGSEWRVVVTKAASINVVANEKIIKIPENRGKITANDLRGLIAHEVGVHMLRSITGEETDLPILRTGLDGYYDSEEGLGKVMEQAVKGEFVESGVDYYLIAGLMYFDGKDFRETYETMRRIKRLRSLANDNEYSPKQAAAIDNATYKSIFRMTRGTDTIPWFKDLAYYNGTSKMWKHCEDNSRDYESFMLTLIGKGDVTKSEHRRIILETRSL